MAAVLAVDGLNAAPRHVLVRSVATESAKAQGLYGVPLAVLLASFEKLP